MGVTKDVLIRPVLIAAHAPRALPFSKMEELVLVSFSSIS